MTCAVGIWREVVAAVAGVGIHFRGRQQALFLVVAQRLHAQVRGAGEVADGHGRLRVSALRVSALRVSALRVSALRVSSLHVSSLHGSRLRSPPAGESRRDHGLDPPAAAAARLEPSIRNEQEGRAS